MDVLVDDNTGTLTKYLNGTGIDEKLRQTTGSSTSYFLADHLGSTNGLADASGSVTASTAYDSFGNQTGPLATRYGFTGRERDEFTGLMYYRARLYDPKMGRFLSEDPIGFGGGDIDLYGYVRNNPIFGSDPLGLYPPNSFHSKAPENLGLGWRGRVDRFPNGEGFEIHVYSPSGEEAGIVGGRNGWIAKHGFPAMRPTNVPDCVINKPNGLNVGELRRGGVIPAPGRANIRGGSYLFGGRTLFGAFGGAIGIFAWADALTIDYDVYLRAQGNGMTFSEQFEEDNREFEYIMTPLGLIPNPSYHRYSLCDF